MAMDGGSRVRAFFRNMPREEKKDWEEMLDDAMPEFIARMTIAVGGPDVYEKMSGHERAELGSLLLRLAWDHSDTPERREVN